MSLYLHNFLLDTCVQPLLKSVTTNVFLIFNYNDREHFNVKLLWALTDETPIVSTQQFTVKYFGLLTCCRLLAMVQESVLGSHDANICEFLIVQNEF